MVQMNRAAIVLFAVGLVVPLRGGSGDDRSLFAQSAAALLQRDFAAPGTSYLLLEAKNGRVLAARWRDADRAIPLGSLVKPFTAIAYARNHERFPRHSCLGGRACWLPRGHGQLDIEHAIAFSCNAYFHDLAAEVTIAQARDALQSFGLATPPGGPTTEQLVGLDSSWRIAPLDIARAYLELARHPFDHGFREVLAGMQESARAGTGGAIDREAHTLALAKTGTAPCTHGGAPGDGFAVALFPAESPSLLLLVRVHGVPGARAAVTAGQMLHDLEERAGSRE
jgi:cell division protein FtsI/penicillin-binding protein 2